MEREGLNQQELAEKAGCSQSLISLILSGRAALTDKTAQAIADAFQEQVSYLMYGVRTMAYMQGDTEAEPIPLGGEVAEPSLPSRRSIIIRPAGRAAADAATRIEWDPEAADLPDDLPPVVDAFKVAGASMAPVLWEGQWVAPDWRHWPSNGDLAVVILKDGRQLVKRYWEDEHQVVTLGSLRPLSPDRPELPEPDIRLPRSKIRRAGRVRLHVLY